MDPAILTVGASTSLKRLIRAAMTAGNDSQFELHTAANSAEAIDVCRGRRFALILIEEPWRLEIELTETAVMRDVMATSHVLEELSADGVRFAMDDFGTGYSSLNHLMLFPIDTLKIDKSFVQDVRTNANAATIVTAIVQLGQSLELEVIAEGIGTAEQFKFLALRGCDAGQGYYFGPPVSATEVPKQFEGRRPGDQTSQPPAAGP